MAYDKVILSAVLRQLEQSRSRSRTDADMRRMQLYNDVPQLREIDKELASSSSKAVFTALNSGGDPEQAINALRDRNLSLQEQKKQILVRIGLSPDYLKPHVNCCKCNDSGYVDGKLCSCVKELYAKEQTRRLSFILPIATDNFSSFRLDYYSSIPDGRTGTVPRNLMQNNYTFCKKYAENFSTESGNLLMYGSTGLGKTFLSSCIAKVVSEKGFSVVYDTSSHIFSDFESVKFNNGNSEQAAINLTKYHSSDLLILDDLGTEIPSSLNTSYFYELLNSRLMNGKPMIINTNFNPPDLAKRYSAPISSRIIGEFYQIRFIGEDIRTKKMPSAPK